MSPDPVPGAVAADPRIVEHRTALTTVTVTSNGVPAADRDVVVAQRDHAFRFGCIGFEFIPLANGELTDVRAAQLQTGAGGVVESFGEVNVEDAEQLADLWFGLFNFATLPFYWGRFEPERGRPDTQRLLRTARWFADRGVAVKGHPLAWHTVTADWLLELSNAEIAKAQVERIHREVADFAGVIDTWDVINEAVIMPVFDKYDNGLTRICHELGRIPLIRTVFDAARETNPGATLLLNDFDLSTAFECLIEGVLEAGIRVDALGLQSHMHQGYWGEEKTQGILDRFSRYGLPIHFTETTILSGHIMPAHIEDLNDYQLPEWPTTPEGEARQADEVVRHYSTLLANPSVQAMTYWGLSDGGWLGAPGGFVRADGSPKPSYEALHRLVKGDWWVPPTTLRTDAEGRVTFRGFLGDYELGLGSQQAPFRLDRAGTLAVDVAL